MKILIYDTFAATSLRSIGEWLPKGIYISSWILKSYIIIIPIYKKNILKNQQYIKVTSSSLRSPKALHLLIKHMCISVTNTVMTIELYVYIPFSIVLCLIWGMSLFLTHTLHAHSPNTTVSTGLFKIFSCVFTKLLKHFTNKKQI